MSRWNFRAVWTGEVVALALKLRFSNSVFYYCWNLWWYKSNSFVRRKQGSNDKSFLNRTVLVSREAPLPSVPRASGTWGIRVSWTRSFSRSGTAVRGPGCCSIRQGTAAQKRAWLSGAGPCSCRGAVLGSAEASALSALPALLGNPSDTSVCRGFS